ncbi:hypothetical protein [Timonella sp. A28]|uniref:hypothetical protein n=1 Tax=Timonella sp. A28 TaxID=3442640 RepID=UPI003EBCBD40
MDHDTHTPVSPPQSSTLEHRLNRWQTIMFAILLSIYALVYAIAGLIDSLTSRSVKALLFLSGPTEGEGSIAAWYVLHDLEWWQSALMVLSFAMITAGVPYVALGSISLQKHCQTALFSEHSAKAADKIFLGMALIDFGFTIPHFLAAFFSHLLAHDSDHSISSMYWIGSIALMYVFSTFAKAFSRGKQLSHDTEGLV